MALSITTNFKNISKIVKRIFNAEVCYVIVNAEKIINIISKKRRMAMRKPAIIFINASPLRFVMVKIACICKTMHIRN